MLGRRIIFHSDFVSRVGIAVAMDLLIDSDFLFEIQLMSLSLHIEFFVN